MSPIYTGDKFGFGASTSAGGAGTGKHVYNNAGIVFTNAGAYGSAGPSSQMIQNEYKDQKFYTDNHYFYYSSASNPGENPGGFIFYRVPQGGKYTFEIRGAYGGQSPDFTNPQNKGGAPWYIKGDIDLVGGRWVGVAVGQKGGEVFNSVNSAGGGGGGTFLFELDGSDDEDTINASFVESASVTCLLVAAGGNGANWQSFNNSDNPARGETTSGNWITSTVNAGNNFGWDIFGRGGFGGSFMYTPYSTVDAGSGSAENPRYYDYPNRPRISGNPLLDINGKIHEFSLCGGVHWDAPNSRYNSRNTDPNQPGHGAMGGFGGGGGTYYEGGGGGGYWGGAAWQHNAYSSTYNYGAQSYIHPTRVTVEVSRLYGTGTTQEGDSLSGMDQYLRCQRQYENGAPNRESHGKLYLCPKEPETSTIGEAVFHADGMNTGWNQMGWSKVTKYDWYVPKGVNKISVIAVGGGGAGMAHHDGGGGGGGALSYKNNIAVTPGQKVVVQVGNGGFHSHWQVSERSPKGTDSKISVYPMPTGGTDHGGSVYFDGADVARCAISGLQFGIPSSTAFGIEAWVKLTSMSSYNNICSSWDSGGSYQNVLFHVDNNGNLFFGGYGGNTWTSNGTKQVTANNWHHVYVGSNGNSGEFYIDGTMCGGWSHNNPMDSGLPLYIGSNMDGQGGNGGGSYRMNGYISNLRYVVGHKTYDSNFTPPTEKLTTTSQGVPESACKLLACQDQNDWTSTDQTSASFSLVPQYGSPEQSTDNPFGSSTGAQVYALAGGGYGIYRSGQSCAQSHTDMDKGLGGTYDQSTSDGGGDGGNGMQYSGCRQGGGGAGGYNGYGKNQSGYPSNTAYSGCQGDHGSDGGGGGGAGRNDWDMYSAGGGGGVGIYGQGANGQKGDSNQNGNPDGSFIDFNGKGGSPAYYTGVDGYTGNATNWNSDGVRGGLTGYNRYRNVYNSSTGSNNYKGYDGGFPGGGGGGGHSSSIWGAGGAGIVRIIWGQVSGADRTFPSTNVDLSTTYDSDADVYRIGTQPQY